MTRLLCAASGRPTRTARRASTRSPCGESLCDGLRRQLAGWVRCATRADRSLLCAQFNALRKLLRLARRFHQCPAPRLQKIPVGELDGADRRLPRAQRVEVTIGRRLGHVCDSMVITVRKRAHAQASAGVSERTGVPQRHGTVRVRGGQHLPAGRVVQRPHRRLPSTSPAAPEPERRSDLGRRNVPAQATRSGLWWSNADRVRKTE